jgi:hypothetical protein
VGQTGLSKSEVSALALEAEQWMVRRSATLDRVVADARLLLFSVDHEHGAVHIEDNSRWRPWTNRKAMKKAIMQSAQPWQCFRRDAQQELAGS